MFRFKRFFIIAFLGLIISPAFGDRVWLTNGDVLSGTVLRLVDGKLIMQSPYTGELAIDREWVESIQTEQEVSIFLMNGDSVTVRINPTHDRQTLILSSQNETVREIGMKSIQSINPEPESTDAEASPATEESLDEPGRPTWKGAVSVLAGAKVGNREAYDLFVQSEAKRTSEHRELTLRGDLGYGESESLVDTTEARFQANLRHYLNERHFIFGDLRLEHDRFEDLDLRADATVGSGYRFWKTDRSELLMDGGVGYSHELLKESADESEPILRLSVEFKQKLFEQSELSEVLTIYPSLGSFGDIRIISQTQFLTPITDSLSWTLNLIDEYDSAPNRPGIEKNDLSFRTGLQYSF